jgi:GT2 family glycosyltransferase
MAGATGPRVSVCIANYQGEALLRDCLDSVFAQAFDGMLEVIVHDDASRDASVALVESEYPRVNLIRSEDNVGFCVANNRMAALAGGDYLLLLNNDAALLPGALAALCDAARHGEAILTLPQYRWSDGALVDRGCRLDLFNNPVPNLDPARSDVAMVIGACLFLPRSLWLTLGGFPEWMGSLAEDLYLCGQARLRGVPVRALSTSGYRHRQGESFGGGKTAAGTLKTTFRRRAMSERNKSLALAILFPGPWAWPLLAAHATLLLAEGALMSLLRRDRRLWTQVYWPGATSPWACRGIVRRQRGIEQAARKSTLRGFLRPVTLFPRKLSLLLRHGLPEVS